MVDFRKPTNTTNYDETIQVFNEKFDAVATMQFSGHTNLLENTLQFNHTSKKFERWTSIGWETLEINIDNLPTSGVQSVTLNAVAKNSSGASINGTTLNLQTADLSFPGFVSTGSQTFAGAKDFANGVQTNTLDPRTTADSLSLRTNNTTRVTLLQTGQVGVGTITPTTTLAVNGSFHVFGTQAAIQTEGAYLEWNRVSSTKKAYLINRSSASGGFVLASVLNDNTLAEHLDVSYTNGASAGATSTIFGKTVLQKFGEPLEHCEMDFGSSGNFLSACSDVGGAKPFVFNVTTNSSNTVPTGGALRFDLRILNTNALSISQDRKIGINTNAASSWVTIQGDNANSNTAALSLNGTASSRITFYPTLPENSYLPMVTAGDSAILNMGSAVGTGALVLGVWSNQTAGIRIDGSTGFVGVGTKSPTTKLHVATSGANGGAGLFESTTNTNSLTVKGVNSADYLSSASTILTDGTNSSTIQLTTQAHREQGGLRVLMGTSEAIFVRTNGNVGLGNIDPQARLHVHNTPASGGTVVEALRLSTSQSAVNSGASLSFYHGTSTLAASISTKAVTGNVGDLFIQTGSQDRLIVRNTGAVEIPGAVTVGSMSTTGSLSIGSLTCSGTANITGQITTDTNLWIQKRGGLVLRGENTLNASAQESVFLLTSTNGSGGLSFYILLSANNTPTSATSHRPFAIDLANGRVSMSNGVTISGGASGTSALAISGGIAATGEVSAATYQAAGSVSISSQGAYMMWNLVSGLGKTHFINHRGSGGGGFVFSDAGASTTPLVEISTSGQLIASSTITSTNGNIYAQNGTLFSGAVSTGNITSTSNITTTGNGSTTGVISSNLQRIESTLNNQNLSIMNVNNASYAAEGILRLTCSRGEASNWSFQQCVANNDVKFHIRSSGRVSSDGPYEGTGADYAEFFEWADQNKDNEDRRGYSVVLENGKIRIATTADEPIGVISTSPSVIGDSAWSYWCKKYLTDDFGENILENYEVVQWTEESKEHCYDADKVPSGLVVPDDATIIIQQRPKLNPDWSPEQDYTPRSERKEWAMVGLIGKLRIRKGQAVGSRWIKLRNISDTVEEWLVR